MNNHGKFSKRVITAMIILFFAGAFFGGGVIIYQLIRNPEIVNLDSFLNYLGLPIGGGVVGYLIKSAMENRKKIECNTDENEELNDLENI